MRKKTKNRSVQMTDTLVGENSVLEGNLHSKASLRIEGVLRGDIECEGDVTIGKTGQAHSNIIARNIIAAGLVEGNIMTKGMLTVTSTGKVSGQIDVAKLSIAEGGTFEGVSQMGQKETKQTEQTDIDPPRLVHTNPEKEAQKTKEKKKPASNE